MAAHQSNTVEAVGLKVGYGSQAVVDSVSFQLKEGRSLLVIGHNGSGKTTLLRTLFCLQPPLEGSARVLGWDVREADPHNLIRAGVRYLGQGPRSFDELRVETHRRILEKLYGWQAATPLAGIPISGRAKVGDLSLGQRRLEALALLCSGTPRLIFLDEPTAGLDVVHAGEVIRWITTTREQGVSFIVVEHNFRPLLESFECALIIRGKRTTFVGPTRPLLDNNVLAAYL
jgi:ABC-type multidrug transport system ATPase subunit